MKRLCLIVLAIGIGLLVVGCISPQDDSSATGAIPSPTPTTEPTSTTDDLSTPTVVATGIGGGGAVTPSPTPRTPTPEPESSSTPQPTSTPAQTIILYFVAIDDGGASGDLIGCNDSLVAVEVPIEPTNAPLELAYEMLLSLHDRYYEDTGLYNALYQSYLQVISVGIIDPGYAEIRLTGSIMMGGACDMPRVHEQLTRLALQFDTVDEVDILINNQPLSVITGIQD